MNAPPAKPLSKPQRVRCAIYTRASTDERLGQEFNSLHNQRELAENYIKAKAGQGWELAGVFEDAGFSGGNTNRPGLKQLMREVQAGRVQVIVVYRMDRISRSMRDFFEQSALLDQHATSIVSITETFDGQVPSGRLARDLSLRFAQYERELIAERTRHKMAASRRKGKWIGGWPALGYDVAPQGGKLLVNKTEAPQVGQIFSLYLEHGSMLPVVEELNRRGWTTKTWTTKSGQTRVGRPFTKNAVHKILTNHVYTGKVAYKGDIYDGEHAAIVDEATFEQVQELLKSNRTNGGSAQRSRYKALLSGLLYCAGCGVLMCHAPTSKGSKVYRYYRCRTAMQRGKGACSGGSVKAPELEGIVVEQIKTIGKDPSVILATLEEAQRQLTEKEPALREEKTALRASVAKHKDEIRRLVQLVTRGDEVADAAREPLADLQETVARQEARLQEIKTELAALRDATVDEADLRQALAAFTPVWDALFPAEQRRVLRLLIERVDYDAVEGKASLTFRPTGIRTLAAESR